jgi:hypothetical protein
MFPTTPVTRRCAAPSCTQIEFVPSPRGALVAAAWMSVLGFTVLLGVELPLPVRIGICLGGATLVIPVIRSAVLLRGARAVHSLAWSADGRLTARLGPRRQEISVTAGTGSFRLGGVLLCLWFEHHGRRVALIVDAGRQDPRSFRALCRRLHWPPRPAHEPKPPS